MYDNILAQHWAKLKGDEAPIPFWKEFWVVGWYLFNAHKNWCHRPSSRHSFHATFVPWACCGCCSGSWVIVTRNMMMVYVSHIKLYENGDEKETTIFYSHFCFSNQKIISYKTQRFSQRFIQKHNFVSLVTGSIWVFIQGEASKCGNLCYTIRSSLNCFTLFILHH